MAKSGNRRSLKESGTCRVFVSSPFGGFEEEREELVLKLFPKLSHLCQSKGLQLATVDMRWGITEEASSDAQTINICLREVDRSDIFIGLYGQRYGWHGESDTVLQKNITNAIPQYPWLAKVKDRSVTEMEMMHGHLNKPGDMPAIFAFRHKAYDNAEKTKAEQSKDTRTALKFVAESEDTAKKIHDLKERVIKTKAKCVALMESYSTPQEGAEFVYKELKSFIESSYLSSAAALTKREESLALHEAYLVARTTVFVGGETNAKYLSLAMQKGQNVVIVGQSGSGKAALISHWLCSLRQKKSPVKQIVHFVGASSDSSGVSELMVRLTDELQHIMGHVTKSKTEQLSQGGEEMKPQTTDVSELCREFQSALARAAGRHKILLAIDGLGKLHQVSRTAKELFWLPRDIPKNVTVVVTCKDTDKDELAELTGRGYTRIQVNPLEQSVRQDMCKELLKQNSKELSSKQMKKIVESTQTGSPLYLKTVISELCAFGKFRELNEKIDELMACQSVKELFQVFIRRLESDYISDVKKGNIIEQVLCSIRVSRKGLSEKELMTMLNLSSHEWSPLFFAMQHVLVVNAGLLTFGFTELAEAVDSRYLQEKNTKKQYQRILASFFQDQLKDKDECIQLNDKTVRRPAEELPWLLFDLGDTSGLMELLSDLAIFGRLFLDQEFELIQLWRWTGLSGEQIADRYLAVVQTRAVEIAKRAEKKPELGDIITLTLISYLMALSFFMEMAHFQVGQEKILMVQQQLMTKNKPKVGSEFMERNLATVQNKLAHLYTETARLQQARDLHFEVLAKREKFVKEAKTPEEKSAALKAVGASFHGIAMLFSKLGNVEEAISYYQKALEFQKDQEDDAEVADTLHNIGVMQMKVGNYKEALELCTKSFQMYEKLYFANMPPAMAVMLGNIAVCHRNLGQVEQAEAMYLKSIEISEKSVGRQHPHVALGLMNIGTLEINRKQFQKAEGYFRESCEIFQNSDTSNTNTDYLRCLEKFIYCLIQLGKAKEAITNFQTLYPRALAGPGGLKSAWPAVYVEMVDVLMTASLVKLAHEVALNMLETGQCLEKCLVHYHTACKILKVPVKSEYTLEKALEKSPGSLTLLRSYVESVLIPAGNTAALLSTMDRADAERKIGADLYGTAATWCNDAKAKDMLFALLEHAAKKFPNESNFICSLANEFYERQEWSKSLVYCRKLVQLEPKNANHRLMLGDLSIREEQFVEAKQVFKDMIAAFPDNAKITTHGKKALEMLEQREKQTQGGKKSSKTGK